MLKYDFQLILTNLGLDHPKSLVGSRGNHIEEISLFCYLNGLRCDEY